MSGDINYRAVEIPAEKPASEYTYVERRAEILQLIEEAGHPDALTQQRLAERYGVDPSQISRDFDRLSEFLADSIGSKRRTISETVYRKAIREYVEQGDYGEAIDALESWNEWLREEGVRDVQPVGADVNVSGDGDWTEMLANAQE